MNALFLICSILVSIPAFAAGQSSWWFGCNRQENGKTYSFKLEQLEKGYQAVLSYPVGADMRTVEISRIKCTFETDKDAFDCLGGDFDGSTVSLKSHQIVRMVPDKANGFITETTQVIEYYAQSFDAKDKDGAILNFGPSPFQCHAARGVPRPPVEFNFDALWLANALRGCPDEIATLSKAKPQSQIKSATYQYVKGVGDVYVVGFDANGVNVGTLKVVQKTDKQTVITTCEVTKP